MAPASDAPVEVLPECVHPLEQERLVALVTAGVKAARELCGMPGMAVTVVVCDDAHIARLHGEHFADPTPTDVITFPLDEESADLVVSVETAMRCAQESGHDPVHEVVLYAVHGTLHACGMDDIEPADRAAMRDAERVVLHKIGVHTAPVDED